MKIFRSENFVCIFILLISFSAALAQEVPPPNSCPYESKAILRKKTVLWCDCHGTFYRPADVSNPCREKTQSLNPASAQVTRARSRVEGIPGIPVFNHEQLSEIFSSKDSVQIYVVWDKGPDDTTPTFMARERATGDEISETFNELIQYRLFSLAFADLYLMDRARLETESRKVLKPNQKFKILLYFQRYSSNMNYFGKSSGRESTQANEELTLRRDFRSHPNTYLGDTAPVFSVFLELYEGDSLINTAEIISHAQTIYGGEGDEKLLKLESITSAFQKIYH